MNVKLGGDHDIDPYEAEKDGLVREVGGQAVWSLSSCKLGYGVEQLRDGSFDTYWQSDGPQPHVINIHFRKKTTVEGICLYVDYKADESYTPSRISIRAGNHFSDLTEVEQMELNEPHGWVSVPLDDMDGKPIRTFMIQIAILSNHQNGRDTHLRQIKVHSPIQDSTVSKQIHFSTVEMAQFSTLR